MQIVDSQDIPMTPTSTMVSFNYDAAETTFFTETTSVSKNSAPQTKFPRKMCGNIGNMFDKDIPLVKYIFDA